MKKICYAAALALLLGLAGCGASKPESLVFSATIEQVEEHALMVNTTDEVGFDKASVEFGKDLQLDFEPQVGQIVEIEALPEIRESYPVQITAVKIRLKEQAKNMEQTKNVQQAEYKRITPQEAMEKMDESAVILDVRMPEEFAAGHIPNAVLLPDTQLAEEAEEVLPEKDQTILVYCRSGRRSAIAAQMLLELGYTDVYDFGGILDWPGEIVQ